MLKIFKTRIFCCAVKSVQIAHIFFSIESHECISIDMNVFLSQKVLTVEMRPLNAFLRSALFEKIKRANTEIKC